MGVPFNNEFSGQKKLDRERLLCWSFVYGRESHCCAKVEAFFYALLHITASVFPHNKLG